MKYDVVVLTEPIAEEGMSLLRNEFRELRIASSSDENQLCGIVSDAQAIVTRLTSITRRVIESAQRLKVIVRHGVGVDNIDLATATQRGVQVAYTPEGLTVSVAEFTIGVVLTLLRRIREADAAARSGNWGSRNSELVGRELFGKTVGIVGLGRIGTEVARRVKTFGVELRYYDLVRRHQAESEIPVNFTPLNMLLEESDIVCLHVPQTKETYHMFGKEEFARMKLGSLLVNMSRGTVVDETALIEALSLGRLSGAAIDVFEKEPLPLDSPLCKLRNVLLSPHMSAHTKEALSRTAIDVAEVVKTVLSGKQPRYLANPEVLNRLGLRR